MSVGLKSFRSKYWWVKTGMVLYSVAFIHGLNFCKGKDWVYKMKSMAKYFISEHFSFFKQTTILWIYS